MRKILFWFGVGWIGVAAAATDASAMITLKQVQVTNRGQVDLLFDGKVGKNQIQTDFFNDIIQLSLNDVSVYPAKISSVNGGELLKIFAYQYAPKLVRCRLTVKGKAEDFKSKVKIIPNGKVITVQFGDAEVTVGAAGGRTTDRISTHSAQAERAAANKGQAAPGKAEGASTEGSKGGEIADPEEKALLEKVMSAGKAGKEAARDGEARNRQENSQATVKSGNDRRNEKLAGGKPLPSLWGMVWKLAVVVGAFGVVALLLKRFVQGGFGASDPTEELRRQTGPMGFMGRMFRGGFGRRKAMIQVVSNHYLGPKKSIAVVKIMGRLLVLGVTAESINLITELPEDGLDDLSSDLTSDIAGAIDLTLKSSRTGREDPAIVPVAAAPKAAAPAARPGGNAAFNDFLRNEANRQAPALAAAAAAAAAGSSATAAQGYGPNLNAYAAAAQRNLNPGSGGNGIRSQIRSRLEGLKQL